MEAISHFPRCEEFSKNSAVNKMNALCWTLLNGIPFAVTLDKGMPAPKSSDLQIQMVKELRLENGFNFSIQFLDLINSLFLNTY